MLWVVELIDVKERRSILSGVFSSLNPPFPLSLFSTIYQSNGWLSSLECGGLWLGYQVLPAIGAVSILELAANSGSSRMSQAPKLHLATQLLILVITVLKTI